MIATEAQVVASAVAAHIREFGHYQDADAAGIGANSPRYPDGKCCLLYNPTVRGDQVGLKPAADLLATALGVVDAYDLVGLNDNTPTSALLARLDAIAGGTT